jgi:ankyrin repeat protein
MRDVRTRGETPLHRAAAYAMPEFIQLLPDSWADREARDESGAAPLIWASEHLRPATILSLLAYGHHRVSLLQIERFDSDHGDGRGNGMDWNLAGDYLPLSPPLVKPAVDRRLD